MQPSEAVRICMEPEVIKDIPEKRIPHRSEVNPLVRRARLNPSDFKLHSLTPDCPGCRAIKHGDPSSNHSVSVAGIVWSPL